jgi:opacity protein-like surface antigen
MSWSKWCVVLGLLVSNAAMAADMPGTSLPPPPILMPPSLPVSSLNWYLRGDVGYYWGAMGGAQLPVGPDPTDNSIGKGFVGGLGAGFKSGWVRSDVTVDYTAGMKYSGTIATPGDVSAKVDAVTALFNGYLDLGTWYGATPYIGAGAGMANLKSSYTNMVAPASANGLSNSQWKFAWAVMAGVGYSIAPNLTLDAGYRYVNFGDVTTASDAVGSLTLKNLAAHEVRVGVRWSFDDLVR